MTGIHGRRLIGQQERWTAILAIVCGGWVAPWSLAQDERPGPDSHQPPPFIRDGATPFLVHARMGQWYPAFGGNFTLGDDSNSVIVTEKTLGMDDNEPTFNGNIRFRFPGSSYERWDLTLDFFDFDTEAVQVLGGDISVHGTTINSGSTVRNDLGVSNIAAHLGYDLFGDLTESRGAADDPDRVPDAADLRLYALGGLRVVGIDHRFEELGPGTLTDVYDESNLALEVGVRINFLIDPPWNGEDYFDVSTNVIIGYGGSDDVDFGTLNIGFEVDYMLNPNMGLFFGYRQIDLNIDDDSDNPHDYDNRLAGLFVGGTIRF